MLGAIGDALNSFFIVGDDLPDGVQVVGQLELLIDEIWLQFLKPLNTRILLLEPHQCGDLIPNILGQNLQELFFAVRKPGTVPLHILNDDSSLFLNLGGGQEGEDPDIVPGIC